jgi:hypothetical protein
MELLLDGIRNEKTFLLQERNCQMDSALQDNEIGRVLKYRDGFKLKLLY